MGEEPELSRRALLLAGAGALAGAAVRPAAGLAAVAAGESAGTIVLGGVGPLARVVSLPPGVAVVGLQWPGSRSARPELRARLPGGAWGPWTAAAAAGHGPEARPGSIPAVRGEPLWVAGAREVEVRSARPLADARLRYVLASAPGGPGARAGAAALALAQPVLDAGAGQPPIVARAAWARGVQLPRVAPGYGRVELAFVHHTENPNGYTAAQVPAMLRAIYVFHRDVNGWNDIGYNFVVDLFGRVFEARAGGIDEPVVGAHAGGYNLVSTGVAVLGSFTGTPISAAARATLERLIAWKLALHGTPSQGRVVVRVNPVGAVYSKYPAGARVSLPRIAGHRDADSTDCPGDALYGELPGVRRAVARLAGAPLALALALQAPAAPPAPAPAPAPPAAPQVLVATLTSLAGAPVAGAPVVLQARSVARRGTVVADTTLAEGATDAEGRLEVPATFAAGAAAPLWVRALHPGGEGTGAAVSPAVRVEAPAAVSPAPEASGPTG